MPTVSEMTAARKARKAARAQNNAPKRKDRNTEYLLKKNISNTQTKNIEDLLTAPLMSDEEIATCKCKLWLMFSDMRYAHTADNQNFAEHIIKSVQRLGALANHTDPEQERIVEFACREAHNALAKWVQDFEHLSPNQRDIVLRPLRDLFMAYDDFLDEAPALLIAEVSSYSMAVRAAKKSITFMELPEWLIGAVGSVISGGDSRQTAKRHNIKYSDFTVKALHAANLLYDLGLFASKSLADLYGKPLNPKRPASITDLRQPMLKMLADNKGDLLVQTVRDAEHFIADCDSGTGISCFDWKSYRERMKKLVKATEKESLAA